MATLVLKDATISVGGTDLSDWCQSVTINYSAETPDDTNMGDTTRIVLAGGMFNWTIDATFSQDFAASAPDTTLFALVGTAVAVIVKPTSAAVSATNPSFTGTGVLSTYNPIAGAVGDKATTTATFVAAGNLVRATS